MTESTTSLRGEFRKYDHLERLKHADVADIAFGTVHVFPKIDGTNASIWCDTDGVVQCGSRNRLLSAEADNAGFHEWVNGDDPRAIACRAFVQQFPHLVMYGEWLVPHSLRTYREDAWRRFYVFDVFSHIVHAYIPYKDYNEPMSEMGIDVIGPIAIIENPSDNQLAGLRDTTNTYLIRDDAGVGEGLVLKNYEWRNKWGRQPWGKMVRNEFKEQNGKVFGMKPTQGAKQTEQEIVTALCTPEFIRKEFAKVVQAVAEEKLVMLFPDDYTGTLVKDELLLEHPTYSGFNLRSQFIEANRHKIIPRFLGSTYYVFVEEEIHTIVRKFKNPVVDFSKLSKLITIACKRTMTDIF